ncbi:MAG: efflux RND transporter permease subunit [Beijerinckiaceae bacterium]
MITIVRIALQRPYTFVVMAMLMLLFGVMSWVKTPTDIFPNITIPVVSVVWTYNGMPPDDMSGRIIYFYERTLSSQVNDIQHMESQSLTGYGVVKVFFQPNVNINLAVAQVTAASQNVLKWLPPGITPPYVLVYNASSVPVLQLALSSDKLSQFELFDLAQNFIRPQLATVAGAAIPSPYGGKIKQVQVDIDQQKLQSYGLAAQNVVDALAAQNLIIPMGTQKIGDFEYIISLNDAPSEIAELNDLPIRKVQGTIVYIRDVAFVHIGAPPQTNMVRVNGKHAVLISILKAGSVSTLDVISGVKNLMPKIWAGLPPDVRSKLDYENDLQIVGDQSGFVEASINNVLREAAIAAILTGLMILLFIGSWRSTLIILVSIPLAILSSIIAFSATGETINVMTLGGLALAVGILVDDATVSIENINLHLEQGEDIVTAIMDASRQLITPHTLTLLCMCMVFLPLLSLGGVSGFLFRPMAKAVVFALIASYVLTWTLVTTLARYLLANQGSHGGHAHGESPPPSRNPFVRFQRGFEHRFEAVRRTYRNVLSLAMGRKRKFAVGFLGVVLVSFALAPFLGQDFFPSVEAEQINLHIRAQTGTRIERTAQLCDNIEAAIRQIIGPEAVKTIVDNIDLPISGINIAYANTGSIGPADADILISLNEGYGKDSGDFVDTLREKLPQAFPGTTFAFLPADMATQILNFGLPAPLDVQVSGPDPHITRAYAERIFKEILRVPGVADARVQQASNYPTLRIDIDRSRAADLGFTEKNIAQSLLDTMAGSIQTAPTFWLDPKKGVSYPIVVQSPQYWVNTLDKLGNLPMTGNDSVQLLGGLGTIRRIDSNAVVSHYNVQPVIDIYATTHSRDLGAVAADIQKIIDSTHAEWPNKKKPPVLRGQIETMQSAYSQLVAGLALSLVLVYLLIVVNFQSWIDPFVIVSALPTALAGIVWMLFTTHTTLSVPALTGAIMCIGVATANSNLVISFARDRLAEGADPTTAAVDAGFTRFRPVLMTALAMIIGMLPMAMSAEQNAPLARAVVGGLMCSTVATLLFVPVMFALVHTRHGPEPASRRPGHGTPADVPDHHPSQRIDPT